MPSVTRWRLPPDASLMEALDRSEHCSLCHVQLFSALCGAACLKSLCHTFSQAWAECFLQFAAWSCGPEAVFLRKHESVQSRSFEQCFAPRQCAGARGAF